MSINVYIRLFVLLSQVKHLLMGPFNHHHVYNWRASV